MSQVSENRRREIEDSKRKLAESIMMINGLLSLLEGHKRMLSERNQADPSNGKISVAKEAVKNMADKIKEVLDLNELRLEENIVTQ
jgi:hypothetical protein